MRGAPSRDLLIQARWVVPVQGPPIEKGWVRLRRGRIAAMGRGAAPQRTGDAAMFDAGDSILMPGLVNAHTHLEFSDMPAPLDAAGGLSEWIGRVVDLRRTRHGDAEGPTRVAAAVRCGLAESAAGGVTAIGEIATGLPAGEYPACSPRLRVFREALGLSPASAAAAGRRAIADLRHLQAAGIAAGISPHAPYSVAGTLPHDLTAAARRLRLPLAMHVAESEAESELLRSARGPFRELFDRLDIWPAAPEPRLLPAAEWITRLARGPRGIVVHATHLMADAEAFARLARHRDRLCVAVCPRTTLRLAGVLPPVRALRAAGIRIAIGTDSRASAPDLSVLAEGRVLVDAGLASPADVIRMVTLDAAWALGFERVSGMLAPGRPGDLVLLRPGASLHDPIEAILDPATSVIATLRGGRLIAGRLPASP